jgi:phage baseplate assembly protein W
MTLGNAEAYTVKYVPLGITEQLTGLNSGLSPVNAGGVFSKQYGVQLVKRNLIDLLSTKKGDRVMLPDYGTNLHLAVFEELDSYLKQDIENTISRAIATYEPRVDIKHLSVDIIDDTVYFSVATEEIVGFTENSKVLISLTVALKEDALSTEHINLAF